MTPEQNGRRLADDIVKHIFLTENICILINISLKFVCRGPVDIKSPLVQVMACRLTGDKPLLEPMMTQMTDGYICQKGSVS